MILLLLACTAGGDPAPEPDPPPPPTLNRGPDPSFKVLMVARSDDGLRWTPQPGVLAEAASSPDLVVVEGVPTVFYVEHGERLARVPLAGGRPEPVAVEAAGLVVDPDVVALPEGGYRLYFIAQPRELDPGHGLRNTVSSARSPDGRTWTVEPGARLEGELVDPEVVALPDGAWRLYATRAPNEVISATSADGLRFTPEPGPRLGGGGVTCTVPDEAGWRVYFHDAGGVSVARGDGLRYGPPERLLTPAQVPAASGYGRWRGVESPAVLHHDGAWWMVFSAYDERAWGPPPPR